MSDLRDFTGKNRKFTGTTGEKISAGTTSERINTQGVLRFNSTTNLMEYYSGTDWKSIDAPPVITSISVDRPTAQNTVTSARVDSTGGGAVTVLVNGSLFDTTGATVTLVGSGETLSTASITRNNVNLLTCTFTESGFDTGNSPYTIKVTNGSGLSAELVDAIVTDNVPAFTNAADTNFNIGEGVRGSVSISAANLVGATDADSDTITYSVTTGSLPSGLSIDSATGVITGSVSAVGSDTETAFTVSATTSFGTATRQFKITVKAPVVTTYNSAAGFTFAVPSGITTLGTLVIGGGGGGGSVIGGGGGAGGMVESTAYPVTPGGNVAGNVGGGGAGQPPARNSNGQDGTNSVFGNITAYGGGGGNSWSTPGSGTPGGSGGGGSSSGPAGGNSTQTDFSPVGATGYGNPGYKDGPASNWGGAGGGAGSGGPVNTHRRTGGDGRVSNMSTSPVTYAGGGGGAGHGQGTPGPGGQGGGGTANTGTGQAGTANRGSGGGGGYHPPDNSAGAGGSGIVIVKY